MKVSIIGATGYTGEELLRILSVHPQAEIVHLTSESSAGKSIAEIYTHLSGIYGQTLESMKQLEAIAQDSDVVFIGLPHGHAMAVGKELARYPVKIIDLGADYRFCDAKVYEKWYRVEHVHPDAKAAYGLTELYRGEIKKAAIVGNPGCFTTASILALTPLVKNKLVDARTILIDAKSGVSGAGRSLSLNSHFTEMYDNLKAYKAVGHRHTPEIEQALGGFAGRPLTVSFTPHLIPMSRGILSTCYATLNEGVTSLQIDAAFRELYADEYFIRLRGPGAYPMTKDVRGSNFCDLGWHVDERTGRVIVLAAIDNLVKGAAGQAVQNMNVMFGLDERSGLTPAPLYP